MNKLIETPKDNGKFEFMLSNDIGDNYKNIDRFSYAYAKNKLEEFTTEFGVTDEPVVLEASLSTFTAMLADFLEDYGNIIERNLTDCSAKQIHKPGQDLK